MQQHVGAPCTPLVKPGDAVLVGQKIADSAAFVSAPIHASVSGTVSAVQKVLLPGGQAVDAVVIDSDGKMKVSPDVKPPEADSLEHFLAAVRESGLVGLGGAGFPTHVKLKVPAGKTVDTLIVNAAECEPYITSDNREALENTAAVFSGIRAVKDMLNIGRAVIAVESNKPEALEVLEKVAAAQSDKDIHVLPLPSRYPQGAEKVLIRSCTGRRVPMGGLPADVGCIVMNITSAAFLAGYLKTGMPLVKKRITVDGSAVRNPQNAIVPIGTRIRDVVEFCGGYRSAPRKILMGGPMMGIAVADDEVPVLKQNNGILCFAETDAHTPEPTACIRCGRCVAGCPMGLEPVLLEKYANAGRVRDLIDRNIADCVECGTCSYNCPAGRPLVQAIRLGKALVAAEGKKNG
jgi:electron transport complex protein RnfC